MATDDLNTHADSPTTQFEQELETLILRSFARGVSVEGTIDIVTPIADTPDWSISIEKQSPTEPVGYDPQFLEE